MQFNCLLLVHLLMPLFSSSPFYSYWHLLPIAILQQSASLHHTALPKALPRQIGGECMLFTLRPKKFNYSQCQSPRFQDAKFHPLWVKPSAFSHSGSLIQIGQTRTWDVLPILYPRILFLPLAAERPFSLSSLRAILTKPQVLLWQPFYWMCLQVPQNPGLMAEALLSPCPGLGDSVELSRSATNFLNLPWGQDTHRKLKRGNLREFIIIIIHAAVLQQHSKVNGTHC